MPVEPGTRFGPYEITAAIGRGGMGEVFRARDARLNRDVAIKVLPDSLAGDPERLARFEREAQVLASLNHPNIAHVYGIDARALIMELVEGQDLASRISQGPIPVDEAIGIAVQVAHALEAAHERGIVHRDLKPANIKLGPKGLVKVLDFGLAKLANPRDGSETSALADSLPVTSPAMVTMGGLILGTAAYMSPEQARGKPVDRQSDIWSFGVVLFEMLTGRTMFAAETVSDTIAAVLTREPGLDELPPETPPNVRRVLQRCLQREPAQRLHHIADARLDLETVGEPATTSREREPAALVPWWSAIALATVTAVIAAAIVWVTLPRPALSAHRYSFVVPEAGFSTVSSTAISPDGKWLAYSPNRNSGPFPLLLRPLDGFDAREITAGPNTGYNPFFSADSRWVAYVAGNSLYKVPVTGGTPERLASVLTGLTDGSWADDGSILLSATFRFDNAVRRAITRLNDGALHAFSRPAANESHQGVFVLPGSKSVLFTVATATSSAVATLPLDASSAAPRVLIDDARAPKFRAGRLLFQRASSGDLLSVAFDPERLSVSGEPIRIAAVGSLVGAASFDISNDGAIVYSGPNDSPALSGFTTVLVSRSGGEATVLTPASSWAEPRVSPDGRTLIVRDIVSPDCILWAVDLQRGTRTRVNFNGDNHNPIWRSDGQLTWAAGVEGVRTMVMGRVDRPSISVATLAPGDYERWPESWSSDHELLAFTEVNPQTGPDIWLLDAKTGASRPFLNSASRENQAQFSRDGRWMAYVSNESSRDEVYLYPIDGNAARVQVSLEGGRSPRWSPDGKTLFFVENTTLMEVTVDLRQERPEISRPRKVLEGPYVWDRNANYDITPDGQRFVFIRRTDQSDPPATLRVLLNWLPQP